MKLFRELGIADAAAALCHAQGGSDTAAYCSGHLLPSFEPLPPPPPFVSRRDAPGFYSVMSPDAVSFIPSNDLPAGNPQMMNSCYIPPPQPQQQLQRLSLSPLNAGAYSVCASAGSAAPVNMESAPPVLSVSSAYPDSLLPSIGNGYWYPSPGNDASRFSSKFRTDHKKT